jgi:uncharacterized protein (DUF2126 family)
MDRQSEAYRHATEADWAGVNLDECEIYTDGDERPIRTPEEFEAENWDAGREEPKSREQAKEALLARIADPRAPDDESVAHAYDLEA